MDNNHLSIIYLHNQRLMVGKANDIMIMKTCYSLSKSGNNVGIITGNPYIDGDIFEYYGLKKIPNFNIIRVPMLRSKPFSWHAIYNFFCLLKLIELKRKNDVDIIYLREIKLARFILRFKYLINLPIVIEVHDLKIKKFYDYCPEKNNDEEYVFKHVNGIIVLLNVFGEVLKETYDIGNVPMIKIPLAADRNDYSYKYSGKRVICYAGQLYHAQGVDLLIKSLNYLRDVKLHIIGDGKDLEKLKRLVFEERLYGRVIFHGFVKPSEVYNKVKDADLMVICARNKGKRRYSAHVKLYEYMAMGKPIVAFDMPSIREDTVDMKNIVLAEPDNPEDLARKISIVLDNRDFAESLAFNAYDTAGDFSWDKRGERLSEFFLRIVRSV